MTFTVARMRPTSSRKVCVVEIDPTTIQVIRSVGVGRYPFAIAHGEGSLWVGSLMGGTVDRVELPPPR